MGGFPLGRQPLRAGMHRLSPYGNVRNISYRKTVINNYDQAMFPMPNYGGYGAYDNGLSKGEKWMLGITGALGGLGAILSAFTGGKKDEPIPTNENGLTESQQQMLDEMKEKIEEQKSQIEDLMKQNKNLSQQKEESEAMRAASKQYQGTTKHIEGETISTTYEVRAEKQADGKVKGDTGYDIVKGLYITKDGKPLNHSQVLKICEEIFRGKAIAKGNIELPNSVSVDGVEYMINTELTKSPEAMHKAVVQPNPYKQTNHAIYKSKVLKSDDYYEAYINGVKIDGKFSTEDAANAVINQKIKEAQEAGE